LNALAEMQKWVDKALHWTPVVGLNGQLRSGLKNVAHWTSSDETCLDITDMGTDDDELFSEEEKEVGEGVIQETQASIQVAAAHVGGGNDGAPEPRGERAPLWPIPSCFLC
jgi:hypothetical protein